MEKIDYNKYWYPCPHNQNGDCLVNLKFCRDMRKWELFVCMSCRRPTAVRKHLKEKVVDFASK